MLRLIIQKELRDNLLNLRFVAGCAISIALIVATIVTLTGSYRAGLAEYNSRQITQDEFISKYAHLNRFGWMSKPLRAPARYSFLVAGIDQEARQPNFVSNPVPVLFSQIDLVGIVTIIMSLMAILFSYNAISGEREGGLLKLMLSTSLPRSTIPLGKYIGGSISLFIAFVIGLLGGLIFVALNPAIQLQHIDLGVFLFLLFASYLYIGVFYSLGLFFSSRSQSSNVAVLKSLFAWVILVLVLPNISPFLAAEVYRIPSKTKIDMQTWEITGRERDDIVDKRTRELQLKYPDVIPALQNLSGNKEALEKKIEADPAFKARYSEYTKTWLAMVNDINAVQTAKAKLITDEFEQKAKRQEHLAVWFASVSPLANYTFISTDLAEAGIKAENDWKTQSDRYFAGMEARLTDIYNKAVEKNPNLGVNDYIDLRGYPRFQFQPQGIAEKVASALPQTGMLLFFNVLFLAGVFISFQRYDVR